MKKLIILFSIVLTLVLAGCAQQTPSGNQNSNQPVVNQSQNVNEPVVNVNQNQNVNTQPTNTNNQAPRITSATFDGNGVVIQGENLKGSYVAFVAPPSATLCREIITPNCVLQKAVSTDTTIKFISNWIGANGSYQIYVENSTTSESNKVILTIPAVPAKAIKVSMWPDVNNFNLNNGTFKATNLTLKKKITVLTTSATKFYRIASPTPNEYFDFQGFYLLIKNWEGPAWPFTLKGTVEGDGPITAEEIYYVIQ